MFNRPLRSMTTVAGWLDQKTRLETTHGSAPSPRFLATVHKFGEEERPQKTA
jgi:hypothetical protein